MKIPYSRATKPEAQRRQDNQPINQPTTLATQAEKKLLLPKTMVSEVRELAEKRRLEDSHLAHQLSHCNRLDPTAPPDLVYDYSET